MKLRYLGTAAAEAVPAPFCECPVCESAREKGGRNIRTRSQALVDGHILLDFPADTYLHTLRDNLKLCRISACFITHPHSDHLYPEELFCRTDCAAHMKEERPFLMYGAAETLAAIRRCEEAGPLEKEGKLVLREVCPFEPIAFGEYTITALKADHSTKTPVVYMIETGKTAMLYAHDTGLLPEESMEYLERIHPRFGLVSYDCTNGLLEWENRGHMGLTGDGILRERLQAMGTLDDQTVHVVNHFSHNGLAGYDELVPLAEEKGFLVAYDGMELEF